MTQWLTIAHLAPQVAAMRMLKMANACLAPDSVVREDLVEMGAEKVVHAGLKPVSRKVRQNYGRLAVSSRRRNGRKR